MDTETLDACTMLLGPEHDIGMHPCLYQADGPLAPGIMIGCNELNLKTAQAFYMNFMLFNHA